MLRPHLAAFSIDVRSQVVLTNRKLGKRGGVLDFEKFFEALLYCDLTQLQQRIADSERGFAALAQEVRGM